MKLFFAFLLVVTGGAAQAEEQFLRGRVIQGPYKTTVVDGGELTVLETDDREFPLSLVLDITNADGSKARTLVDRYDVAGSDPNVESIFFYPVRGQMNVIVLVSWKLSSRGAGTYGTLYQVYGYSKAPGNVLIANKLIEFNKNLGGIEGYQEGAPQIFKYKDAATIKAYIKNI